jgi:ABC-2 type transport system ATP-binding protein
LLDIPELLVAGGEVAALVGPVGSGNDLLLALLTGKTRPTLGSVRIQGCDPAQEHTILGQRVGVLFPEDGLYERQSAKENLAFYCRLHGIESGRAEAVLQLVGLADQGSASVSKLSSSLRRRLAFGRAILHQPEAMIVVEPFKGCDGATIALLGSLIRSCAAAGTVILILATEAGHLEDLCDVIYKIEKGRILESYRPQEAQTNAIPFKIPVRLEGKVILVNPVDILFADASAGKAILYTCEGRFPTQFTLSDLESRLNRSGFFRAHRSYLVNLQHVKEVIPYTRNSFSLRLDDPHETVIPLSKQAAGELKDLLGF